MKNKKIRKVCVVIVNRANYGRIKYVMKAIKYNPNLELQIIVAGSAILEKYGKAVDVIEKDGFKINKNIFFSIEGDTLLTQSKSTGLAIIEISSAIADLNSDMVITVADRYETIATAIASTYLNIPLIHIQGGEVSGNIDDRVRNAITKLADYHFVASEESYKRVLKMGEEEFRVFNYGCPAMDILENENLNLSMLNISKIKGIGIQIDWNDNYILVVQHPVTTSYGQGLTQIEQTLAAVSSYKNIQKIILWPNIDAGSEYISKGIRLFREKSENHKFFFIKNFSPEDYARVLANSKCCVGNSSSFIRECGYLGVPAVVVGDRQTGREHARNVLFCSYSKEEIISKIDFQLSHGKYPRDNFLGLGNSGLLISNELEKVNLMINKKNSY